jgi:hypothetical protein
MADQNHQNHDSDEQQNENAGQRNSKHSVFVSQTDASRRRTSRVHGPLPFVVSQRRSWRPPFRLGFATESFVAINTRRASDAQLAQQDGTGQVETRTCVYLRK